MTEQDYNHDYSHSHSTINSHDKETTLRDTKPPGYWDDEPETEIIQLTNRQMNTQEHLTAIVDHCKKNLALAEKRTPGKWLVDQAKTWDRACGIDPSIVQRNAYLTPDDADFIAACSNSAEAGWRATIALCNLMQWLLSEPSILDSHDEIALSELLESFPIESL